MQRIYFISIISLFTFFISCSDNEITDYNTAPGYSSNFYNIESSDYYNINYMSNSGTGYIFNPLVKIGYDRDGKIVRRTGSINYFHPDTGITGEVTNKIYDDVSYSNNKILIVKKASPGHHVYKYERTITLNSQNKPLTKVFNYENPYPRQFVIHYFYNLNGTLKETRSTYTDSPFNYKSTYDFNLAGNLESVVTTEYYGLEFNGRTVEKFGNYDEAENPLKKLIIFENTFYRALSKNNYKKYDRIEYNSNNEPTGEEEHNQWNLSYDFQGKVRFDRT